MDPVTHRRMRTAHLNHSVTCPCGRQLYGNGRTSHQRVCPDWLRTYGWPLDQGMQQAIRDEYPRVSGIVLAVERELGRFYLDRRAGGDKTPLSWRELRDLVWQYAEEVSCG